MRVLSRQTEADQHAGNFKRVVHLRDERDGPAFANEHGLLAETFLQSGDCLLEDRRMKRGGPGLAHAQHFELQLTVLGNSVRTRFSTSFAIFSGPWSGTRRVENFA